MKLYRSHKHTTRWYAFQPGTGFLMFPAEAGGWAKRQPARGFDPIDVREVPLSLASETGILGTGDYLNEAADAVFPEAA
jgi:hypothetical protein